MTDIVEQLRHPVGIVTARSVDLYNDAADEIDRLREVLREIAGGYGPNHGSKYCRDLALSATVQQPFENKEGGAA